MSPAADDNAARNRLVEEHTDLAEHFARRYSGRGLARDDLRQMALLAMVKAADRFEPARGVAFATFASRTIDGELKRQFRDRSWSVRPPRALQELHLTLRKVDEELTQELGRHPRLDELAERLEVGEEDVLRPWRRGQPTAPTASTPPSATASARPRTSWARATSASAGPRDA